MDVLDPMERDNERLSRKYALFSDFTAAMAETHHLTAKDHPAFTTIKMHNNKLASLLKQASTEYALLSADHQRLHEDELRNQREVALRNK